MSPTDPAPWLLLAASLHLGFQLTITMVAYPALVEVPPGGWARAHDRHSRRIVPLVAAIYPALVVVLAWTLVAEPRSPGTWVALAGGAASILATAFVAAPLHGRLSQVSPEDRPAMLVRLVRADRARTAGALVCLVGAALAALSG